MTAPLRTIPKAMPTLRAENYFTRRSARAELVLRLAQAQNYLWAHGERIYGNGAYEGNGNKLEYGVNDPAQEQMPNGAQGLCLLSFFCPPNWGASQRLKVQGRTAQVAGDAGSPNTTIVAALYELDGTLITGSVQSTSFDKPITVTANWVLNLSHPGNRPVQCRVWMGFTGTHAGDSATTSFVSARFQTGNTAEIGGDDVQATWQPTAHFFDVDMPLSSALLVRLVENTNVLYALRPPELCQSWLGNNYANTATFAEVGRYVCWVGPRVSQLKGKLNVYCTHGGVGNEVQVLVDGVVVQTFTALPAGESNLDVNAFAPTSSGAENTLTIEARSTAAGADWGTIVHGVYFWEESVDLALPAGTAVPAAYQPLDEEALKPDDRIVAKLNGTRRAGVYYLLQNDTWLARHRLRWLVGDWRHRALKRAREESAGKVQQSVDWTRGAEERTDQLYHPKNITVRGDNVTADGTGSAAHDAQDGFGKWQYGLADVENSGGNIDVFPTAQIYRRHGRRLWKTWLVKPTGMSSHLDGPHARMQMWFRGRRLRPDYMKLSFNSPGGPAEFESFYVGRGWLESNYVGSIYRQDVLAISIKDPEDISPRWLGPQSQLTGLTAGGAFDVRGRIDAKPYQLKTQHPEGLFFELELQTFFCGDEPLGQIDLNLLA